MKADPFHRDALFVDTKGHSNGSIALKTLERHDT
jgi:hypothetical protein